MVECMRCKYLIMNGVEAAGKNWKNYFEPIPIQLTLTEKFLIWLVLKFWKRNFEIFLIVYITYNRGAHGKALAAKFDKILWFWRHHIIW